MSEVKKCPKCGNALTRGKGLSSYAGFPLFFQKHVDRRGHKIIPFYCENCGYIEFYNEENVKTE